MSESNDYRRRKYMSLTLTRYHFCVFFFAKSMSCEHNKALCCRAMKVLANDMKKVMQSNSNSLIKSYTFKLTINGEYYDTEGTSYPDCIKKAPTTNYAIAVQNINAITGDDLSTSEFVSDTIPPYIQYVPEVVFTNDNTEGELQNDAINVYNNLNELLENGNNHVLSLEVNTSKGFKTICYPIARTGSGYQFSLAPDMNYISNCRHIIHLITFNGPRDGDIFRLYIPYKSAYANTSSIYAIAGQEVTFTIRYM